MERNEKTCNNICCRRISQYTEERVKNMETIITVIFVWTFVILVAVEVLTLQYPQKTITPYTLIYTTGRKHAVEIPLRGYNTKVSCLPFGDIWIRETRKKKFAFRIFQEGNEIKVIVQKGKVRCEEKRYIVGETFIPNELQFKAGNTTFQIRRNG